VAVVGQDVVVLDVLPVVDELALSLLPGAGGRTVLGYEYVSAARLMELTAAKATKQKNTRRIDIL
jgi:hypothetical protein